ncbi:MAG: SRPBCC domain-containing protein [Candidatus Limnocylindrales bacterium]
MTDQQPPAGYVSVSADASGLKIVRVFDAPRELVFKAWTEPRHFAAWFGEHGSSMPLETVSMDARPGGAWSAIMVHGPGQVRIPFSGRFREVVPPERVVLTLTDQPEPSDDATDVLTAVFRDLGSGRTEMTFTQLGGHLPSDEYSRALRGYLIFFERMAAHLAADLAAEPVNA